MEGAFVEHEGFPAQLSSLFLSVIDESSDREQDSAHHSLIVLKISAA